MSIVYAASLGADDVEPPIKNLVEGRNTSSASLLTFLNTFKYGIHINMVEERRVDAFLCQELLFVSGFLFLQLIRCLPGLRLPSDQALFLINQVLSEEKGEVGLRSSSSFGAVL